MNSELKRELKGCPGGNATCINFFTAEMAAKRLGLLRELLPSARRVTVLVNPTDPIWARDRLQQTHDRLQSAPLVRSRSFSLPARIQSRAASSQA
jgi:hypothetical protein